MGFLRAPNPVPRQRGPERARRAARAHALAAAMLLLATARGAEASAWFTYGFGSRAIAMGNAFAAVSDDYSASYTNPAGLVVGDEPDFGGGLTYYDYALDADGPRSTGAERVDGLLSGFFGTRVPLPVEELLGFEVAMGFAMQMSGDTLLEQDVPFPTVPHFALIENYPRLLHVLPTSAVGVAPGLSVGGGALLFDNTIGLLDLGLGAKGDAVFEIDQELKTIFSPILGIRFDPAPTWPALAGWTFGLVWRDSFSIPYRIPVNAFLGGLPLTVDFSATALYTPMQVEGGVAWTPGDGWLLAAGLVYNRWSDFPDPALRIGLDLVIPLLGCVEDDPECNGITFTDSLIRDPGFRDTWSPRVGVEARAARWETGELYLRGGYAFEASPVPEQTGDTNFLDSDRHVLSAGVGLVLDELLGRAFKHPIRWDVHAQVHLLPDRTHHKEVGVGLEENPGFPSVTSGGLFYNVGFSTATALELL